MSNGERDADRGTVFLRELDDLNLLTDFRELRESTREAIFDILLRMRDVELHDHAEAERAYRDEREADRVKIAQLEERSRHAEYGGRPATQSPLVYVLVGALLALGLVIAILLLQGG